MTGMSREGIVIRSTGSWYSVMGRDGQIIDCRLKGKFKVKGIRTTNPIAVGDHVEYALQDGGKTGVIISIAPRRNYIIRKATKLSKASHILAANLDQAIVMATLAEPRTSTGFIDRFLITAEAYHIPGVIIFNKADLYDGRLMEYLESLIKVYEDAGYPCLVTSAVSGLGVEKVRNLLADKVSLLAGHSGVGKSALINVIEPGLDLKTQPVSRTHLKGMHTTTFAHMHKLSEGGFIIDTPGIREFGLYELEKSTLAERYPEMRALMHECRYKNCTHLHEPGCAVKKALRDGRISRLRYDGYVRIMNDEND